MAVEVFAKVDFGDLNDGTTGRVMISQEEGEIRLDSVEGAIALDAEGNFSLAISKADLLEAMTILGLIGEGAGDDL